MDAVALYLAHPFLAWVAAAAVFLALEVATGTGYLLWPAACAVLVAVVALVVHLSLPGEILLFAVLTLATTLAARRYLPNPFRPTTPDINDSLAPLVGAHGLTAQTFLDGHGRVFVDGKEWAAELEGAGALERGAAVQVVGVKGGACLRVRAG